MAESKNPVGGHAGSAHNDVNNAISSHKVTPFVTSDGGEVEKMLVEDGKEAFRNGDFDLVADCFRYALEYRVAHYGKRAPQCASIYYWYGRALLFKARKEADPWRLGFLKASKEKIKSAKQMLDTARAIADECSSETMQKALLLLNLARIAIEMEDSETSLSDCGEALRTLQKLVEWCKRQEDNGLMAEGYFQMCLCLEICSKLFEVALYCEKAMSTCRSHMKSVHVGLDYFSKKPPHSDKKAEVYRLPDPTA